MKTWVKIFALLLCIACGVRSDSDDYETLGKTCDGVVVRKLQDLEQLKECQVVEGSVKLLLFDGDFSLSWSFTVLKEITGFLIIHKVSGLKSISQLFPSLVRIHGEELFQNYSLIVTENPDLENLGLSNLSSLAKGAIRVERNEMLCYVNTVDWTLIVNDKSVSANVINGNMDPKLCPRCENSNFCWSRDNQQAACNCNGGACNAEGACCKASCLSCHSNDVKICTVCKKNIFGIKPHKHCVETCPHRSYQYLNYRCLTEQECKNLNVKKTSETPFIPYKGVCQEGCPDHFQIKYTVQGNRMSASCSPCRGRDCWSSCEGGVVDSLEAAQRLQNCQVIEGPLEIQLRSRLNKSSLKEFESYLSEIVEIEDYLKIARSPSIVSLGFLKTLKLVRGNKLYENKHSLVILDNERLTHLFDEDQVELSNGNIFIQFNTKLCFDKVESLAKKKIPIENYEMAKLSNGDKSSCNVTKLASEVIEISKSRASVQWDQLKLEDGRSPLNFVLFYTEIPEQGLEAWEQDDDDSWNAEDVTNQTESTKVKHTLTKLKPFTRYAFYVKAYTSPNVNSAQSDIQFFSTLPGTPEQVSRINAISPSSSEIKVSWELPKNVNGKLAKYQLRTRKLDVMKDKMNQRDFCREPVDLPSDFIPTVLTNPTINSSLNDDFSSELAKLAYGNPPDVNEFTTENVGGDSWEKIHDIEGRNSDFTIENLDHFSSYVIDLRACREKAGDEKAEDDDVLCGLAVQIIAQTLNNKTADDITHFEVESIATNTSMGSVRISWKVPENPNGHILNYVVKQSRVDKPEVQPELICISLFNRANLTHQEIGEIKGGKYSFQISATTLAGQGNFTELKYAAISTPSIFSHVISPAFLSLIFLVIASIIGVFVYKVYQRNQPSAVPLREFESFDTGDH